MRKLLVFILLQLPYFIYAQEQLNIKGELSSSQNKKKVYLVHIADMQEKIDSAEVFNGKFEFNINLKQPSIAIMLLNHDGTALESKTPKDILRFFIEPGKAILKGKDSIATAKISGLSILKENEEFTEATKPIEDKLTALNKEFQNLPEEEKNQENVAKGFQKRFLKLLEERKVILSAFIKANPQSYISLYSLNNDLATEDMNVPQVKELYNAISPFLKENTMAKVLEAKLEQAKITGLGVDATDFEEKTLENVSVKLSSYKGKYVLVDFWASWCGPCRQENPNLVAAFNRFKNKGFEILGVSIDTNKDAWKKAIKTDNLTWVQLLDTTKEIAELYSISSIPQNYLIDPSGKIIAKNLRGDALEEKLEEIFQ
jgi:peroxiredoxin